MHKRSTWFVATILLGGGCNTVLGIDQLPGDSAAYASPLCESCVLDRCLEPETACLDDAACSSLYRCLAQCEPNDLGCRQRCEGEAAETVAGPLAQALDSCRRQSCLDECLGPGGVMASVGAECSACFDDWCAEVSRACVAEAACERTYACSGDCDDPECLLHCGYDLYGLPSDVTDDLEECFGDCAAPCARGERWDCVEQFSWGTPETGVDWLPFTFKVRRGSLTSTAAGEGLSVDVCAPFVDPCAPVSSPAATVDATGRVQLELPVTPRSGFLGYLRISGTGAYPTYFFFGRPITRTETAVGVLVPDSEQAAVQMAAVFGAEPQPGLGHLAVGMWDCWFQEGAGVTLSVDDEGWVEGTSLASYFPVAAEVTAVNQGTWFAFNLTPGWRTVTARRDGRQVSEQTVLVRADQATQVQMFPAPHAR
ncbi:MAG: hypothetical protein JRI55_27055 [Deltaproteobacteria bacterium]|nr:hypothetical protein [Deltaproteobacteria bacterium]